jgi:uncharacterized membrane protein
MDNQPVMKNPLYDRQHVLEYLLFGALAAIAFVVFSVIFLINNKYENLYLIYVGNVAFVVVISIYNFMLINRAHEGKSTVRMMIPVHIATLIGIILAVILSLISVYAIFGSLTDLRPNNAVLEGANASAAVSRPAGILIMILIYATVANFAFSSFISVLISYVGKKNQTKDKPAELDREIQMSKK